MNKCPICGEIETTSKTYRLGTVVYTMSHFVCKHPREDSAFVTRHPWLLVVAVVVFAGIIANACPHTAP